MNNVLEFRKKKWGVMCHYLYTAQNNPEHYANEGVGRVDWSDLIDEFDVQGLAKQLHDIGANYLLLTVMQGSQFMCAPNATYDCLTGYKAGEACSLRDLPLELYNELKKYGIDLFLYFTGDGPHIDEKAGRAIGYYDGDKHEIMHAAAVEWIGKGSFSNDAYKSVCDDNFVRNWASVLKEYAERYKGKVKGWWIDGCYRYFGYTDEKLKVYCDVLKEADENYLIAFNDGFPFNEKYFCHRPASQHRYSAWEDYTAGEALDFDFFPEEPLVDGSQWHVLSHLSSQCNEESMGWNGYKVKYTLEYLSDYLEKVWQKGGVVTIDMGIRRGGLLWDKQVAFMTKLNKRLKEKGIV